MHILHAKLTPEDKTNATENACKWSVTSNLDDYNVTLPFTLSTHIKAETQGDQKVSTEIMCIEQTDKCYSTLFIISEKENAKFNVTISKGEQTCQLINLDNESKS